MNATFISILPDCLSATTNVKCGSAMNKISQRDPDKRTGVSLAVVIEYIMKRLQNYRPAKRIASLIASLTGKIFVKSWRERATSEKPEKRWYIRLRGTLGEGVAMSSTSSNPSFSATPIAQNRYLPRRARKYGRLGPSHFCNAVALVFRYFSRKNPNWRDSNSRSPSFKEIWSAGLVIPAHVFRHAKSTLLH